MRCLTLLRSAGASITPKSETVFVANLGAAGTPVRRDMLRIELCARRTVQYGGRDWKLGRQSAALNIAKGANAVENLLDISSSPRLRAIW